MKTGLSIILLTIIIALILTAIPVAYFYGKGQANKNNNQQILTPETKEIPESPAATPTPSSQVSTNGTITGTLSYPSEFLPKGKVFAKNINTGKIYSVDYEGLLFGKGTESFSISVPEGTYYLKYEAHGDSNNPEKFLNIYYTSFDQNKTHTHIPVKVVAGETVGGIQISDGNYSLDEEPEF